ncbi:hypothetical protein HUS23_12015 [Ectothiorhodospiraceae bacterium 2226]|nr:hypothetical protein HUS23_12015 [Ectothiorhodospiraceae bacterium 2226]
MRNRLYALTALAALALVLASGCAGRTQVPADMQVRGAPDWVNKGTQVLRDRGGRLLHGVGMAAPLGDLSLQSGAADDRARAEIARLLTSVVDVATRDFVQTQGDATQQAIYREIYTSSRATLHGARIVGRWRDPRTGDVYSLAELDLQQVERHLRNQPGEAAAVADRLTTAFDSLSEGNTP